MLPSLPEKYYLAHANELFAFVQNQCSHLLTEKHIDYLNRYETLSEDAQCLLVRLLSRKPRFIARDSLQYPEIEHPASALTELIDSNLADVPGVEDWCSLVPVLTKAKLFECLADSPIAVNRTVAKAELLAVVREYVAADSPATQPVRNAFLVRRNQPVIDYILFLFFGDLRNRFQKFAMRDLGVLRTRKPAKQHIARFDCQQEALSAFELQCHRRDFLLQPDATRELTAAYLLSSDVVGTNAKNTKDKLLVEVAGAFAVDQPQRAIRLWRASNDPRATEAWVRESYKNLDREILKRELEDLRAKELPAITKIFIEDFYARKYQGKRTSVFTDLLREQAYKLPIDEVYVDDVEQGVIAHYQRHGIDSWFTENRLWRVLFAFTFWDLLFDNNPQHSEFDRLPAELSRPHFYTRHQAEIEERLQLLSYPTRAVKMFAQQLTRWYGTPTGIFRWRDDLLDSLIPCVELAPPGALAEVLRRMAHDYHQTRDGYPDLMVIENGELRFEEIKSPGDVLRPNQLVSINRLRRAGLNVDVTQVEWATDPKQTYAVVDIETTGGRRGLHSITEIAVVKVRNQQIVDQWSTLVNPQRSIPANISRLTNITDQMVASAPVFTEIADQLEAQLAGNIFVAHNVGFDYGFIKTAYQKMNRSFRKPKYCTVRNARKTFPGLDSYSLGNLTNHFDIDLHNAHRALSDATATAHLLILIQQARSNGLQFPCGELTAGG